MEISVLIAGFDLAKADDLRKAIGKCNAVFIGKLRTDFLEGGERKGYSKEKLISLFNIIAKSGSYVFNRSHACAYTMTSYICMWYKVYFPLEWAIVKMNMVIDNKKTVEKYVKEVSQSGIKINPPDINKSCYFLWRIVVLFQIIRYNRTIILVNFNDYISEVSPSYFKY
jgi:DNA polymerase-3 subunit alpha